MMAARFKSQEMRDLRYFSHTSPVYGGSYAIPLLFGVKAGGENLANGNNYSQEQAEQIVNAWLNSPGHRALILNNFHLANNPTIGIGIVPNGGVTLTVGLEPKQ